MKTDIVIVGSGCSGLYCAYNLPRDKEILILRYGLNNKKEYTQKEVADMLGISQSYISRIEKKAIKRLKSLMKV